MTTELQFADLIRRTAERVPAPNPELVEAGIAQGRKRLRQRRRRNVAGVAALAAAVGVGATVGIGRINDDGPDPAQEPRIVNGFGVTPDQMGDVLSGLLAPGASALPDEDLPADLTTVLVDLGFPNPSGGAVSRSGAVELGGVHVGVVVRRDSTDTRRVEAACEDKATENVRTECADVDGGILLSQYPDGAAVVTYLVSDGWLVQVVTDDASVVEVEALRDAATEQSWLR